MSNLLKYNNVIIKETDKFVIDSNQMVNAIIEQQSRIKTPSFAVKSDTPDEDGFVCGLDAATVEQLVSDPELPGSGTVLPADIMEEAKKQAEDITARAREDATRLSEDAKAQGYADGMAQAKAQAQAELNEERNKLEAEYSTRKEQLEQEYVDMKAQIEPELVDTLIKVFSKVTYTMAEDKKDIILHLVDNVMRNADICKEFLIKVCDEDYKFLMTNKDKIYGATSSEIHIDICRDSILKRNQCIIETDAGVFDCSLDIQLENLIKDIKLLSCMNK